jgi:hypothetical protein
MERVQAPGLDNNFIQGTPFSWNDEAAEAMYEALKKFGHLPVGTGAVKLLLEGGNSTVSSI